MLGGALLGRARSASKAEDKESLASAAGYYREAESLLLAGYPGMKQREDKIPPQFRVLRVTEALERLEQLYDAWGKKDEAAKWRKEQEQAKARERRKTPANP